MLFQACRMQVPAEEVQEMIEKSDATDAGHSDDKQTNNSDSNLCKCLF